MGFCPLYTLFSFQHTMGSWTADPQGSFPSFVAFCSPTLHGKDLIFPIFMDTPEYGSNWACSTAGAWGGFCEWPFLGHHSLLLHSMKWYVQHCLNARRPRFSFARLRFSPARENIINRPYSITPPLQQYKQQRAEDVSTTHL